MAVVAAWPALAEPGLLNTRGGGDSPFLLQRLHQLVAALADGHFPARWMPDAAYGDGYPFYNFYAPLSIYIAAAFRFIGFSFVRAIHLAQLTGFIVAGLGAFYLGRRWLGSEWAGLLAAVAYTAAPFHMVNVYVRGDSLAEFWAMAWYPWVLLAAARLVVGGGRWSPPATRIALFALAYAALILSHNISALIFSPFLLLYLLLEFVWGSRGTVAQAVSLSSRSAGEQGARLSPQPSPKGRGSSPLLATGAGLILAFALAAWFFVPALAEQDMAQLGPVTEGYFHYSNHFRGLDLVQGGLLFDYNPDGGLAFRMGLVQVGLAVVGCWSLVAGRRRATTNDQRPLFFMVAGFLIATFMITPLSRPLWDHLPLLPFTQFPWRFLSVQALFGALLTGGLVRAGEKGSRGAGGQKEAPSPQPSPKGRGSSPLIPRSPAPLLAVGAGLVLAASALLGLTTDHLILTDADVTAERLAQYEWFTGNIGTTISAEYLTPAADPRPWTSAWLNSGQRDRAVAVAGEATATVRERTATRQAWDVTAGPGGATIMLPALYWPGWRATVGGQPADLSAQPGSGLMTLTVPAGDHTVALELQRTPVRAASEWLSLIAALVTIALLIVGRRTPSPFGRGLGRGSSAPATDHSPPRPPEPKGVGLLDGAPSTGLSEAAVAGRLPAEGASSDAPRLAGPSASEDADSAFSPRATDHWLLFTAYCLLLTILTLAWRNDPRELPPGDLTWDFAQLAYLHHDPDGVAFENGARLYEYGYSADELAAGQTMTVTLSVAPGDGRAATLALVTPASARPTPDGAAPPPVMAAATVPLSAATAVFVLPIPPDAPPGLYVPRLTLDGARPLLPSGGTRGDLFLRPVRVVGRDGIPPLRPLGSTAAEEVGYHPALQTLGLSMRAATTVDGRFAWYTARPLGARYQFSWRLQDAAGGVLAQLDAQPGYGFQPSMLWPAGQWTADWLALRLPDAAPAEGDYPLVMRLYDPGDGRTLLTRRVGVATWANGQWTARLHEPTFVLPGDLTPTTATFGDDGGPLIALPGYRLERDGDMLRLTLYWQAGNGKPGDFTRFVHLLDAAGNIVAQVDGAPAGDSYPTGQWLPGEVVADALAFDLSPLPPGDYRLAVGFYAPTEGLPRLNVAGADGPLPDGRFLLPDELAIE